MENPSRLEADRNLIRSAREQGHVATLFAFARLSGPGWLQSAITLGGGSLAGSLYLGVIAGYDLLWLQPVMMILGLIMLSSISYVSLSTGRRPFDAINEDVNPVLGWGWIIATLMANLVWAMPQFSLGTAAIEQNLLQGQGGENAKYFSVFALFAIAAVVVWFYDSGGWGIKLFDILLKIMVATVVICFFGVVIAVSFSAKGLDWGAILTGFIPNPNLLFSPADRFAEILPQTTDEQFWRNEILSSQRDRMVTAAATAVGINMTFLMPYSMLKRGWDRDFRGLAVFDLATGLFIPFVLATSCVVIAAASQFHGTYDPGLVGEAEPTAITKTLKGGYDKSLDKFAKHLAKQPEFENQSTEQIIVSGLNQTDRQVAAMLVKRDANVLANSLEGLTGKTVSQFVFGVGVLGMAISTIIILMLINGFTICEMMGLPSRGPAYIIGCLLPGLTGSLGFLFLWSNADANFWLAVPTSVFGMVLLPIAYITFFLMMNNDRVMGEHRLRGLKGAACNVLMLVAVAGALVGASWSIWGRRMTLPAIEVRWVGIAIVALFVLAAVVVQVRQGVGRSKGER